MATSISRLRRQFQGRVVTASLAPRDFTLESDELLANTTDRRTDGNRRDNLRVGAPATPSSSSVGSPAPPSADLQQVMSHMRRRPGGALHVRSSNKDPRTAYLRLALNLLYFRRPFIDPSEPSELLEYLKPILREFPAFPEREVMEAFQTHWRLFKMHFNFTRRNELHDFMFKALYWDLTLEFRVYFPDGLARPLNEVHVDQISDQICGGLKPFGFEEDFEAFVSDPESEYGLRRNLIRKAQRMIAQDAPVGNSLNNLSSEDRMELSFAPYFLMEHTLSTLKYWNVDCVRSVEDDLTDGICAQIPVNLEAMWLMVFHQIIDRRVLEQWTTLTGAAAGANRKRKGQFQPSISNPCASWFVAPVALPIVRRYIAIVTYDRYTTVLEGQSLPNGNAGPTGLGSPEWQRHLIHGVRSLPDGPEYARRWQRRAGGTAGAAAPLANESDELNAAVPNYQTVLGIEI